MCHYVTPSLIVLSAAAVIANILGYTFFKNIMAAQYLGATASL